MKHVESLSQLLHRLFCITSIVSAPLFGTMIKSSGQMFGVGELCVLRKELSARRLRPRPATFGCIAESLVMNGQPDDSLKLIFSPADSEELWSFINTVTYTTALSGFAMTEHDKEASMSACQSAACWVVWHTASCFSCLFNILNRLVSLFLSSRGAT